jgi:hypothetical protein
MGSETSSVGDRGSEVQPSGEVRAVSKVLHSAGPGGMAHIVRPGRRPGVGYDIYWCGKALFRFAYPADGSREICALCVHREAHGEGAPMRRVARPPKRKPGPAPKRPKIDMTMEAALRHSMRVPKPAEGWPDLASERAASLARQRSRSTPPDSAVPNPEEAP